MMMLIHSHHWLALTLLSLVGCIAGTVDTISGGGGLLTIPAMLLAGLPPGLTLGTNKFQACFGSGTATFRFMQTGHLHWRDVKWGMLWCLLGASAGTIAVLILHSSILAKAIPVLLVIALLYSIFSPRMGDIDQQQRWQSKWFFLCFGLVLGFYDGFFGPGTGSFWALSIVFFLGFNLRKATMHAKVYNFVSNVVSLVWFIFAGQIAYKVGLIMAIGQLIGAWIGSHLVMHHGTRLIRPIFIVMVAFMTLTVLVKTY